MPQLLPQDDEPESPKFFFQEKYARLGVKGNFMPLSAQPPNVDLGEWLAHQAVEQYRLLEQLVSIIMEANEHDGQKICNPSTCPTMSAGRDFVYTWLNSNKEPVKVPAVHYIQLVQRWIVSKINDTRVFPTDPPANPTSATPTYPGMAAPNNMASAPGTPIPAGPTNLDASLSQLAGRDWVGKAAGFPESFFHDIKTIFRQLFRIYGHLYHSHWVDPFWHISDSNGGGWTDLNSCFVHFVTVVKLFGLMSARDMEPMQPLIDIWVANGSIPPDAANGACTIIPPQ